MSVPTVPMPTSTFAGMATRKWRSDSLSLSTLRATIPIVQKTTSALTSENAARTWRKSSQSYSDTRLPTYATERMGTIAAWTSPLAISAC